MQSDYVVYGFTVVGVKAALPNMPDCRKLEDHVLDTSNPGTIFGTNSEIGTRAAPVRIGNLRQRGPIPTHHFAASQLKSLERVEPMRLFPYEGKDTSVSFLLKVFLVFFFIYKRLSLYEISKIAVYGRSLCSL